jgi:hypothetical protein
VCFGYNVEFDVFCGAHFGPSLVVLVGVRHSIPILAKIRLNLL